MVDSTTHPSQPTPACVGIIMDGNRRWAHTHNLPTVEGHRKGYETLKEVAVWCKEREIHHLAVYAFSTENWKRSEEEVGYLMDLMRTLLQERLAKTQVLEEAVHVVGDYTRFPVDIQELITTLHARNSPDATYHLWVCASYGGKPEILAAVNSLLHRGVGEVTEEEFTRTLWSVGMPAPDIIIRTGGEKRLSNFLLWLSGYSELFFLDTYWPDFSKEDLNGVLTDFASRKRNYGA